MKNNDITLCLIVKNEQDFIGPCIESVMGIVSEILIADTGSIDNTLDICKRYTKNVETIDFSKGFSEARNHLLKKVKTSWVLFLDADEYFDEEEARKISQAIEAAGPDVDGLEVLRYNFFSTGGFYTSNCIKIFRAHPEIFYTGVVVDSIKPSISKKGGKILQVPILLNHFGHCRPVDIRNRKAQTYLQMMDDELKQNPDNFRVMGYKALVLRSVGKMEESVQWWKRAVECKPDASHPHFVGGHILRALGSPADAIAHYTKALELEKNNPIFLNSRGITYLSLGNHEQALKDFEQGLALYPHYCHFKINIGLVQQSRGEYKAAVKNFEEVAHKHPAFLKTRFDGCTEFDPYSGLIFDTIYNFKGLAYHLYYCERMKEEEACKL